MAQTRPIGQEFTFKGVTLVVRESAQRQLCSGCYFAKSGHPARCLDNQYEALDDTGECAALARTDRRYVVFVEKDEDD